MSALFLAAAVKQPLVVASGMVPDIVWRGFSRRDELERVFPMQLPPSRVAEADKAAYYVTLRVEFDKADVEALAAGSGMGRPAGVLHGMPSFILMKRKEDDKYGVAVTPSFMSEKDDALSTQDDFSWSGQDDDELSRAFGFTLVRCSIGQRTWFGRQGPSSCKTSWRGVTVRIGEVDYDEDAKLKVELDIEIKQHKHCRM